MSDTGTPGTAGIQSPTNLITSMGSMDYDPTMFTDEINLIIDRILDTPVTDDHLLPDGPDNRPMIFRPKSGYPRAEYIMLVDRDRRTVAHLQYDKLTGYSLSAAIRPSHDNGSAVNVFDQEHDSRPRESYDDMLTRLVAAIPTALDDVVRQKPSTGLPDTPIRVARLSNDRVSVGYYTRLLFPRDTADTDRNPS